VLVTNCFEYLLSKSFTFLLYVTKTQIHGVNHKIRYDKKKADQRERKKNEEEAALVNAYK
jgi:hypothetical protein